MGTVGLGHVLKSDTLISCQSVGWCCALSHAVVLRGEHSFYCSSDLHINRRGFFFIGPSMWFRLHTLWLMWSTVAPAMALWPTGIEDVCAPSRQQRSHVLAAWVCEGCFSPQRTAKLKTRSMCLMLKVWGWAILSGFKWTVGSLFVKQRLSSLLPCSGEIKYVPG